MFSICKLSNFPKTLLFKNKSNLSVENPPSVSIFNFVVFIPSLASFQEILVFPETFIFVITSALLSLLKSNIFPLTAISLFFDIKVLSYLFSFKLLSTITSFGSSSSFSSTSSTFSSTSSSFSSTSSTFSSTSSSSSGISSFFSVTVLSQKTSSVFDIFKFSNWGTIVE